MRIRVFLVDDEPAVRKGLAMLLSREPDIEVCGNAGCASEALKQILMVEPDLAIIDLCLEKGNGLDLVHDLRSFSPKPRILVFSMHSEAAYVRAAFRAGADGYLNKDDGTESLVQAIRAVMGGDCFLAEALASKFGLSPADLRRTHARTPGHD